MHKNACRFITCLMTYLKLRKENNISVGYFFILSVNLITCNFKNKHLFDIIFYNIDDILKHFDITDSLFATFS